MSRRMEPRIPDTFGAWIYEQRTERHWNQDDLSKRTGLSKSWISSLERNVSNSSTMGNAPRPYVDVIDSISDAFGVDADEWRLRLGYSPRYANSDPEEVNAIVISQNKFGHVKLSGTPPPQEKLLDTAKRLREEAVTYRTAADRLEQTASDLEKCVA